MNCKFCLMSSGGCVYVLVSSEQFSVVSCIHDDTFLKQLHSSQYIIFVVFVTIELRMSPVCKLEEF
jgi:uncharacterized membrane protein YwzB